VPEVPPGETGPGGGATPLPVAVDGADAGGGAGLPPAAVEGDPGGDSGAPKPGAAAGENAGVGGRSDDAGNTGAPNAGLTGAGAGRRGGANGGTRPPPVAPAPVGAAEPPVVGRGDASEGRGAGGRSFASGKSSPHITCSLIATTAPHTEQRARTLGPVTRAGSTR
jgi:translation initiation factor IF-2